MQDMILYIYIKFRNTDKQKLLWSFWLWKFTWHGFLFLYQISCNQHIFLLSQKWEMFCWVYVPQTASVIFNFDCELDVT